MYLSEEQAGLRANRSTVQQILTLHLIAVKAREYNQPVHNCFIDFKKAFDSVWHKGLWAVLESFGVTYKIVRLLQTLYVLVDGSLIRWFQMTVGNREGDPILPNTFLAFLERIMDGINEMEDKGVIIQGLPIYNLKVCGRCGPYRQGSRQSTGDVKQTLRTVLYIFYLECA